MHLGGSALVCIMQFVEKLSDRQAADAGLFHSKIEDCMVWSRTTFSKTSTPVSQIAILSAFAELEDPRRRAGQRHNLPLCLALFTLAIAAGNKGFLAIGDWIKSYRTQLIELLDPPKNRLPSYSTVRRALLHISDSQYSACLARFFDVKPVAGETIALDGCHLKHKMAGSVNHNLATKSRK